MALNRIITTAWGNPEGLAKEIVKALMNYNNQVSDSQKVVFLEINGDYYKGTVKKDRNGKVTDYHKLTIEKMRAILTASATWRTLHKYSSSESGWMVKNGGACPRQVAVFAVYHLQSQCWLRVLEASYRCSFVFRDLPRVFLQGLGNWLLP